jgi:hypothetical protein
VQQRGQPRPIHRLESNVLPVELVLQHRELMAQRQYLDVLVVIAAGKQPQQRKRIRDTQVRQSQQHEAASSHQRRRWVPTTFLDQITVTRAHPKRLGPARMPFSARTRPKPQPTTHKDQLGAPRI